VTDFVAAAVLIGLSVHFAFMGSNAIGKNEAIYKTLNSMTCSDSFTDLVFQDYSTKVLSLASKLNLIIVLQWVLIGMTVLNIISVIVYAKY